MLYTKIMFVGSDSRTKHINEPCAEVYRTSNVTPAGTYGKF
jgi:hypothetical protein